MPTISALRAYARILVVDDSSFERRYLSELVRKAGFNNILTAEDGEDALQKTADFKPDLVLLDLVMPKLDGFGYIERCRKNKDFPRMPILVQTSMHDRDAWLQALAIGADDFLTKPLDAAELTLRMRVHIDRFLMFCELEDMCRCLRIEIDFCRSMIAWFMRNGAWPNRMHTFNKHHEVLQQILYTAAK